MTLEYDTIEEGDIRQSDNQHSSYSRERIELHLPLVPQGQPSWLEHTNLRDSWKMWDKENCDENYGQLEGHGLIV